MTTCPAGRSLRVLENAGDSRGVSCNRANVKTGHLLADRHRDRLRLVGTRRAERRYSGSVRARYNAASRVVLCRPVRVLAEETRGVREQYRDGLEVLRQEREAFRHAAGEARPRQDCRGGCHGRDAEYQPCPDGVLEDARNTLRYLKPNKPGDRQ